MIDPTSRESLRAAGFEGFVSVGSLREAGLAPVPERRGVYLLLAEASAEPPRFLPVSPAGGGLAATQPAGELEERWVPGAIVLYVGRADGKATLRSRVGQFLDFGRGKRTGHRDGRAVWQIPRSAGFVLCWQTVSGKSAWGRRRSILEAFREGFGRLPFGNARGD
ncbi:MAG: hypothetical protein HKM95_01040 [Inquilinus sp.]|nr:hypothetical protein [Inquilinus sp.]